MTEYKPVRILIVEDNPGDVRLVQEFLEIYDGYFEIECVERLSMAIESVKKNNFDVILLDLALPDSFGLDTVDRLYSTSTEIPIIVLTGNRDEDIALKAVQAGAQDYLVKGQFDSDLLVRSIRYAIERKKIEEDLLESERRYKDLFENANIMIQSVNQEGRFITVNREWLDTMGYSLEEVKNLTVFDILDKDCIEHCSAVFEKVLSGEPQKNVEARFVTKNGRKIDVEGNIFSRVYGGKIIATHGIFKDVSEKKRAEKELKESEERYRTTFEHTGTAMLIVEEDTTISLVNSEFEKLSGYSKEEIEGKMSWTQFVHPDDIERIKNYHYARREGRAAPTTYEFRAINRRGDILNIFIIVGLIPGTKKCVASLIDITPLRRLNNLLRAISEINEIVAKEKETEKVLKSVCRKLALVYGAIVTSIKRGEGLLPVGAEGISLKPVSEVITSCPANSKALEGKTIKLRKDELLCSRCMPNPYEYVLSIPLLYEKVHGVIVIHSNSEFNDEEVALIEKLSRNIAFALTAHKIEKERERAFEQLTANIIAFDKSADRLRNPLSVIMSSIELRKELGSEKVIEIIKEQSKRIKEELDELRKEEVNTYKLAKDSIKKFI